MTLVYVYTGIAAALSAHLLSLSTGLCPDLLCPEVRCGACSCAPLHCPAVDCRGPEAAAPGFWAGVAVGVAIGACAAEGLRRVGLVVRTPAAIAAGPAAPPRLTTGSSGGGDGVRHGTGSLTYSARA